MPCVLPVTLNGDVGYTFGLFPAPLLIPCGPFLCVPLWQVNVGETRGVGSWFAFPRECQTECTVPVRPGCVLRPARYTWAPYAFLAWDRSSCFCLCLGGIMKWPCSSILLWFQSDTRGRCCGFCARRGQHGSALGARPAPSGCQGQLFLHFSALSRGSHVGFRSSLLPVVFLA